MMELHLQEKKNLCTGRKTCPNVTVSTTNLTLTDVESNASFRSERAATKRLSHGTVSMCADRLLKRRSDMKSKGVQYNLPACVSTSQAHIQM
jgi:hypothetical protein